MLMAALNGFEDGAGNHGIHDERNDDGGSFGDGSNGDGNGFDKQASG